jgi:ribosomal protein S12 methylthiotransferase accessory factor
MKIAFKPHYALKVVDGEGIILTSDDGFTVLLGRQLGLVASCIDGRTSPAEIVEKIGDQLSPDEVHDALGKLERSGYLGTTSEAGPTGESAFWSIQGIDPGLASVRLRDSRVTVSAFGTVVVEPFVAALQSLRINVGSHGRLGIVLTDDYLRGELEAYNREALASGNAWVLIKPVGCEIWVGPLFRPGMTGCWECLAHRLRANREVHPFFEPGKNGDDVPYFARCFTPASLQVAWNWAASKIAEWIVRGESSDLDGHLFSFDVRNCKGRDHILVQRMQCPACGDITDHTEREVRPIALKSQKKAFVEDGGHRQLPPEATLERFQHHVSPITGLVKRLERLDPPSESVVHAYLATACWPSSASTFAIRRPSLSTLKRRLRSVSGGKGASDSQAKASGICEALERYSCIFQGDEPRFRARMRDLGPAAIHPNDCMRFSDRQYRLRGPEAHFSPYYAYVPAPFDDDAVIDWSPVWSLTRDSTCFLPTDFCYHTYLVSDFTTIQCVSCSNGCAAGNSLEEAILQGFLELVERDGVAMWWYNRLLKPEVDWRSFDDPYLERLAAYLAKRRRNLWFLDLTTDLHVPIFVALSQRTDRPSEQIIFGFGCHFEPRIALRRAATELNQWSVALGVEDSVAGNSDDLQIRDWLSSARLVDHPHLSPQKSVKPRAASSYSYAFTDDLKEDVLACQALVERHGMEMLVLDQSRPDVGLPVVKVIVPGLRHFWKRFAPGRLYDVPVKLGWLAEPLDEAQLNPIPIFF